MSIHQAHNLCANAVKILAIAAIERAQSGHPGVVLGFADVLTVLWRCHMRFDTTMPDWQNRDRFVLSNGHASALYYAILHVCGFDIGLDDLAAFRQMGSKTPGHPERDVGLGIDVATGPLGQGLANAVGMALAQRYLDDRLSTESSNKVMDFYTYAAVGDGCLMEGVSHEACSLAGRLGLGHLIVCWDDNGISIDGEVDQWSEVSVVDRFRSYGWQVIDGVDGHDPEKIDQALNDAKLCFKQPTLICFKTKIGRGTDWEGSAQSHGKPLGKDRFLALKNDLGWVLDDFCVSDEVYHHWQAHYQFHRYDDWVASLASVTDPFWRSRAVACEDGLNLPEDWQSLWQEWLDFDGDFVRSSQASRHSSQYLLSRLIDRIPFLIGGSADLAESTGVRLDPLLTWQIGQSSKPFIHFGVREFAMFAIANGLSTCMGIRPFVSTFLVFSDYGINAVRMAALMRLPVIFIFSHDSVFVGEDGPTHQPVEQLSHLRAIPNLDVWRPGDAFETGIAWKQMLERNTGPSCLVLSRQKLQPLGRCEMRWGSEHGACRIDDHGDQCHGLLLATGSEVGLALEVQKALAQQKITVGIVSMICVERFDEAPEAYQKEVLPNNQHFRLILEAGSSQCWYRFLVGGIIGEVCGVDQFGQSAPGSSVYAQCGFSVDKVVHKARTLYERAFESDHSVC